MLCRLMSPDKPFLNKIGLVEGSIARILQLPSSEFCLQEMLSKVFFCAIIAVKFKRVNVMMGTSRFALTLTESRRLVDAGKWAS